MSTDSARYGIITDLHANWSALSAVLDALEADGIEQFLCMGDLAGYGPSPHEVVERVRSLPAACIRGNHDRYTLGEDTDQIRPATAQAIDYGKQRLDDEDMAFLRSLKDTLLYRDRILLCHGSLRDRDEYIVANDVAIANYTHFRNEYAGVYLCFCGHTHVPLLVGDGRVVRQIEPGQTFELKHRMPYIINVGSVGQPRDANPDAAFGVLDMDENTVTFKRVAYDIEDTHRRVVEAGLQRHLGDRLRIGR
jgi:diadenosine tetraphosphatase ApaH/serine/threonine PP2A family protein phosphatase